MSKTKDELIAVVVAAARKTARGCDCEYDYRCGRCQAVIDLHEAVEALDAVSVTFMPTASA